MVLFAYLRNRIRLSVFGLVLILFLLSDCKVTNDPAEVKSDGKIIVSVSIPTYKGITEKIGGDKVEVTCLLPRGISPEEFDPSPSVIKKAAGTDLYIRVGETFEFENIWLSKIKSVNNGMDVFDSSEGVEEKDHNHHVWNGTNEVKIIAGNIYKKLAVYDSVNAGFYKTNYERYLSEIDSVDSIVKERLGRLNLKTIVTYHPAWTYFTNTYGLQQLSIEDHGKMPNANDLARLVNRVKEMGIKAIFVQPQFETNTARIISEETGAKLIEIDPLPEDFLANIIDITNKIEKYNE